MKTFLLSLVAVLLLAVPRQARGQSCTVNNLKFAIRSYTPGTLGGCTYVADIGFDIKHNNGNKYIFTQYLACRRLSVVHVRLGSDRCPAERHQRNRNDPDKCGQREYARPIERYLYAGWRYAADAFRNADQTEPDGKFRQRGPVTDFGRHPVLQYLPEFPDGKRGCMVFPIGRQRYDHRAVFQYLAVLCPSGE